ALAREKDEVDNQILVDKDLHYRTFDLSNNPFNSNEGAAFHKMIGGYDPAKLSRYQDLISELLSNQQYQNAALDMLNCKYVIGTDSMKRRGLIPRPSANGNAWFVQKLTPKDDAVKEMEALKAIDNKKEAVFNITVKNNKGLQEATFQLDSTASAKLTSYHPDTLKYNVSNTQAGYLVFSEIFYEDWKVEIDGKEATLNKVDYTLRGVNMPAGNHQVKLYFKKLDSSTDTVDFISSLVILGLVLLSILLWLKTYTGKSAND
ncbi:MAG: YfhO family protein, partial [Bacteroidetes bacterium]|nr:YfhO family protein [Bacteroidota bacterium]